MSTRWIIVIITAVLIGGLIYWTYRESSKPLIGQKVEDQGRGHIAIGTEVKYNSNPPTSGPHYEEWTRTGIFNEPQDDRNLVHSLEHGYVIISYNCNSRETSLRNWGIVEVLAHEDQDIYISESTPSAEISEQCHQLVDQLKSVFEKKKLAKNSKLIIVPRPSLETKIALSAWNYLDKFNPSTSMKLDQSDIERIEKFIDTHRGQGPESTME